MLNVVPRGMAGAPMITKPAVVPVVGALAQMVLSESVAIIGDGHCKGIVQVEHVNTSVAPAPSSVSVTFSRSSVVLVLPWLSKM